MRRPLILAAFLGSVFALPAIAQDNVLNFKLRGGIGGAPSYPGADDFQAVPDVGFTFGRLKVGRLDIGSEVGSDPRPGWALRGAFKFVGERDPADEPELAGLDDVDAAVELGLGLVYRQPSWQVFGEVRQGFGGHDGVTATLGGDVILRPDPRWTIIAGPRVNFGNATYANTYFGVTPAEAAASAFNAFDADGGAMSAGLEVSAIYDLNGPWALEGAIRYEKLLGDAADSPITQAGSDDQLFVRIGVSRVFDWRF